MKPLTVFKRAESSAATLRLVIELCLGLALFFASSVGSASPTTTADDNRKDMIQTGRMRQFAEAATVAKDAPVTPVKNDAPTVQVAFPRKQKVGEFVELTGNAQSPNHVDLVARVEGFLEKVHFKDGQIVKAKAGLRAWRIYADGHWQECA